MTLPVLLILAVLLVAWPFLSVLGNERQRQMLLQRPLRTPTTTTATPPAGVGPGTAPASETPVGRDVTR